MSWENPEPEGIGLFEACADHWRSFVFQFEEIQTLNLHTVQLITILCIIPRILNIAQTLDRVILADDLSEISLFFAFDKSLVDERILHVHRVGNIMNAKWCRSWFLIPSIFFQRASA